MNTLALNAAPVWDEADYTPPPAPAEPEPTASAPALVVPDDGAAEVWSIRRNIIIVVAALLGLGLVMVYSTAGVLAHRFGSAEQILRRQAVWTAVGLLGFVVAAGLPYRLYYRLRWPILLGTLGLLVVVLFPALGTRYHGARRWLRWGGFGFQPSEVAKLGLLLFLAAFLARRAERTRSFWRTALPGALLIALPIGLLVREPDVGTAALFAVVLGTLLFVGGVRLTHLLTLGALGAVPAAFYVWTHLPHIQARIAVYLDPAAHAGGAGYQPRESLIALGSGGFFGNGLGQGSVKHFLPEAYSDYILAAIGNELGFVGAAAVVLLFFALIWQGLRIVRRVPDRFGALVACGITLFLGLQAALNVAVVTNTLPPKGIALPLVSAGGTSLVLTLFSLGVLLNIAGAIRRPELAELAELATAGAPATLEAPDEDESPAAEDESVDAPPTEKYWRVMDDAEPAEEAEEDYAELFRPAEVADGVKV